MQAIGGGSEVEVELLTSESSASTSGANKSTLRLRSSTERSSSSATTTFALGLPKCSPFVSLTALSALAFLLMPSEFLYSNHQQQSSDARSRELEQSDEFCCGGGPFSYYAAFAISISCDRHSIHLCCDTHDLCYEQRHLNQTFCDDQFCACLDTIRSSAYCEAVAHPGLCLATRVFGHMFYMPSEIAAANCTATVDGQLPPECLAQQQGPVPMQTSESLNDGSTDNADANISS